MRSLQRDLQRWILVATAAFALLAGVVSGTVAFYDAQELQDAQLRQIAGLVATGNPSMKAALPAGDDDIDPEDSLLVQWLDSRTKTPFPSSGYPDGLHTLTLYGKTWRAYVLTVTQGAASPAPRVLVAQQTEVRDEVAWGNAFLTGLPMLLLAPLLMGIASFTIRHNLKSVRVSAAIVDQRDDTNLDSLDEAGMPQEITPFLHSINRLLQRVKQAVRQQQRFVADAAHELRTPVTALSLLAENLANATTPAVMQERLPPVLEGLARLRTLIAQLLDLARLQGETQTAALPVDLRQVVQAVMGELHPLAEAKSIDLGMLRHESLSVGDVAGNLSVLVRNAIENAIRYTPVGGVVDVSLFVEAGRAVLQVEDNGYGIPEAELAQVLEPFYRVGNSPEPGNGLGLAISQEIARRLDGEIRLANRPAGGLVFQYRQPFY